MKIKLFILFIVVQQTLFAQPVIPAGTFKIRSYCTTGVLFLNTSEKEINGNLQLVGEKVANASSDWKIVHSEKNTYKIQHVQTGMYLGIHMDAKVPMSEHLGGAGQYIPNEYFLFLSKDTSTKFNKWHITFYKQHKTNPQCMYAPAPDKPYDKSDADNDVFDIINIGSGGRLSTVNVNGIMSGDNTSRAYVHYNPNPEKVPDGYYYDLVPDPTAKEGHRIVLRKRNTDFTTPGRGELGRWQLVGGRIAGSPLAAWSYSRAIASGITSASKPNTATSGNTKMPQPSNEKITTKEKLPIVKKLNTNTKENEDKLEGNVYVLSKVDVYSLRKGERKKLPGLLSMLAGNKLELRFMNEGLLEVRNKKTNQTIFYNWQIKDKNILSMIPKNNEEDSFIGMVRFEGNKMIHIVNEGNKETEYIYEKN